MKIEKKYIITGVIGLLAVGGMLLYLQYKKLMNYTLKFRSIKVRKIQFPNLDFDVFLDFTNNSNLKIEIQSQEYKIYLNNVFISNVSNSATNTINPVSTSTIGVNIKIDLAKAYKALGLDAIKVATTALNSKLKVDIKLKVKMFGFTFNIPYIYEAILNELITPSK